MRPGSLPIAVSAVFAALALAQSQSPVQLEAEKTFDRKLAAGGNDLVTLDLKTDQIVELKLEDQGTDVILSVYNPDGRLSRAFSSARQKGDALEFLATQPGRWSLKIAAREGNSSAAYRISDLKITTPHTPAAPEPDISPRIRKITNQAEADAFWKEIGPNGSPLIEPIKDDPINRFTTFLWRGSADTQRVFLNFRNCSPDPVDCFLHHVEGTDVWYRTLRLDHRLRTTYLLTPNAPALPHGTQVDADILSQVTVRSQGDDLGFRGKPGSSCTPRFLRTRDARRAATTLGWKTRGDAGGRDRETGFRERAFEKYAPYFRVPAARLLEKLPALRPAGGFRRTRLHRYRAHSDDARQPHLGKEDCADSRPDCRQC